MAYPTYFGTSQFHVIQTDISARNHEIELFYFLKKYFFLCIFITGQTKNFSELYSVMHFSPFVYLVNRKLLNSENVCLHFWVLKIYCACFFKICCRYMSVINDNKSNNLKSMESPVHYSCFQWKNINKIPASYIIYFVIEMNLCLYRWI